LIILTAATTYLLIATRVFHSSNMYKITLPDDATEEEKQMHGDGTCNFDSNTALSNLVYYSFSFTILLRLIGHVRYRKRDPLDFKDFANNIDIIFHAGYGIWTLTSIYYYMSISQNCRELRVMSMLNFELFMILGSWSAV
jgi:hypothetical protein